MKDTGNYKQANNRTAEYSALVDVCVLKQETVPSGNGRTLETGQWDLGGGGRVEELMLARQRGALMGGQGWRKLWLCGGPCVFGVIGS